MWRYEGATVGPFFKVDCQRWICQMQQCAARYIVDIHNRGIDQTVPITSSAEKKVPVHTVVVVVFTSKAIQKGLQGEPSPFEQKHFLQRRGAETFLRHVDN